MSAAAVTLATAVKRRAIGLCAEYDAPAAIGCGCGHTILASSAGAPTLREVPDQLDLTIKLLVTTAEKSRGGTVLLFEFERGVFDDVAMAMAMMVQPAPQETCACSPLAGTDLRLGYAGTAAPAAAVAPDVVAANTSALYHARAPVIGSLQQLETRVWVCVEAGAVATRCTHEVTRFPPPTPSSSPVPGLPPLTARRSPGSAVRRAAPRTSRTARPAAPTWAPCPGCLPAIHPTNAIDCGDAVNHRPEPATPSADRAGCDGAPALALTGLAAATDDAQRDRLIGGVSRRHAAPEAAAGGAV